MTAFLYQRSSITDLISLRRWRSGISDEGSRGSRSSSFRGPPHDICRRAYLSSLRKQDPYAAADIVENGGWTAFFKIMQSCGYGSLLSEGRHRGCRWQPATNSPILLSRIREIKTF